MISATDPLILSHEMFKCVWFWHHITGVYNWLLFNKPGLSWSWSYGSWIYYYLCNQSLSPLTLWVWILLMVRCTQHYVIQFVSDLQQVSGFLRVLRFVIWNVTYIEVIAKNCIRFRLVYVLYLIFILTSRILYKSTTYPGLYHVCPISSH
jgi:hypothetical protein